MLSRYKQLADRSLYLRISLSTISKEKMGDRFRLAVSVW